MPTYVSLINWTESGVAAFKDTVNFWRRWIGR